MCTTTLWFFLLLNFTAQIYFLSKPLCRKIIYIEIYLPYLCISDSDEDETTTDVSTTTSQPEEQEDTDDDEEDSIAIWIMLGIFLNWVGILTICICSSRHRRRYAAWTRLLVWFLIFSSRLCVYRELIDAKIFQRGSPGLGQSVVGRGYVLAAVLSEKSVPSIDCRPQKPARFRGCVRHLHPRSPPDPAAHGDQMPSILFWPASNCSSAPASVSNAAACTQSACFAGIWWFSAADQLQQRQQSSDQRRQDHGLGWNRISLG